MQASDPTVSEPNLVAFAIPIFLGAVILEALIARRRGDHYNFGTAISDLGCGTLFQGIEVLFKLLTLGAYVWLFEHARWIDWAEGHWAPWVIAFVGVDLLFYWWHRASHVVNFLWAVHGVHHQSEDFNLAVALRQPTFEPLTWFLFFAPLAFLGVSPLQYVLAYAINRFYQFWIHTELVRRVGPFEWILNTPSHHRVHHGVNPQYLDKNYGAILIIWDRLFGTFEIEDEAVVYGTTVPLESYNPVWANFSIFARIGRLSRIARRSRDKLWAPFAHPAWLPEGREPDPDAPKRLIDVGDHYEAGPKYRPEIPTATKIYVAAHFALAGIAMFGFLWFEARWSLPQLAAGAAVAAASTAAFAGLVERRPWALGFELLRLVAMFGTVAWLGSVELSAALAGAVAAVGAVVSFVIFWVYRARLRAPL